jgi:aminoglycoside 2'-N-acetyltransferase I
MSSEIGPSRSLAGRAALKRLPTEQLTPAQVSAIRGLLWAAFGDDPDDAITEADWEHALGGMHFLLELDGQLVAHAAVVEREIQIDGRPLRTGYVEAVATAVGLQRMGLGSQLMTEVGDYIRAGFELGALGTGSQHFYARLGWRIWRGPSLVRTSEGPRRTPDEDGYIMVLATPASPELAFAAPISCDWRPGDVW